jgi:signal transduction histidine kinase
MKLEPGRNPKKILYVEDNPDNRVLVRVILESEGYTIVDAEDGLAGIEMAIKEQPALILLDVNLPGVDGYEVGVILKSFPTLSATPIIAVTAYAMEGDRERALAAGCDGYIKKPIDPDLFPAQVAEFLQGKREQLNARQEAPYLKELNERLVYRMVKQIEELQRLSSHFAKRATELEQIHLAFSNITSEVDVAALLNRLLPPLAAAISATRLSVELLEPSSVRVSVDGRRPDVPVSVLGRNGTGPRELMEVEWTVPLTVHGREMGLLTAACVLPGEAKAEEEHLLRIVANKVAIAIENARLYEGVQRQMAELQQAQAQLIQSAKLAAIGELAANVAHELNNPLTTVLGFASVMTEVLAPGAPLREEADLIVAEAGRARDIVRDLLDFSRQRKFVVEPAHLGMTVSQVVTLVRTMNPVGVNIVEEYAPELPLVEVDPARMKQVFLNLINNAISAMPRGGHLRVRTCATEETVDVVFDDSGIGIPAENLGRIFEPFFTTKPDVSGTGLGLSVSLGIVRQHGGTIDVVSEVGKGSTFTVKIPRTPPSPSSESAHVPDGLAMASREA